MQPTAIYRRRLIDRLHELVATSVDEGLKAVGAETEVGTG